ncbi:GmrSD restriction endonuclease domain-containing protein [Pseudoclavibacter caeni]|uniref:DUF262 domain-containing protein n=1 Tax=Pseudoclavibacter caeni TaxID=908846 RepID=A0A7C8FUB7_9MICO|nr:DUF262 domain-containing protein [Pseudoclavibacter caeni]KAB1632455.1 DUF262 domain-containing protein [Pseudoclavibacter caeni]NYJ97712.1 hypothetical protein [Pseudoclavibacter caeni]
MGKELFDNIPSKVEDLLRDVELGKLGLPDLQRPFVWPDSKVRNLLDSMLKGYPIGYIMLWSSPDEYDNAKQIGDNDKTYKEPDDLVIDGQQRLTALLAALHGTKVRDKNYQERTIRISFNPLTREFAVWTQAYERNTEWISSVSSVFEADRDHSVSKFRKAFIRQANEGRERNGRPALTDEEEDLIEENLNDLLNLGIYTLPTLKINSKADEEDVAEIFVRVNSGGTKLTEKNFIETLLAVFDNEVHARIDRFCAESRIPKDGTAYNQIIEVDPSHLIRIAVGVGFRRARLKYAYMLLRGKDLTTGITSAETRKENLGKFKDALDLALNLNNWHAFLNLFGKAGYLKGSIVASTNAVVFSYVLYLIGKYDYKVPAFELNKVITKWIFMATITGFYTGSTESEVEKQFADLREVTTPESFVPYLESTIATRFTDDFFTYSLPSSLEGSSANSPSWFGYVASLIVLGMPMLFSTSPLAQYFTIGASGKKNAIDKHHIFPKNYLTKIGYDNDRERNQIANFTYLDYNTNIEIGDKAPAEYVSAYREKLGEEGYAKSCRDNALPLDFENLEYPDFLAQRRVLMANIVKKAYEKLCE